MIPQIIVINQISNTIYSHFIYLPILAHMQQDEKDKYPLYQYCNLAHINKYKDKLISVVGKVVEINDEEQVIIIEVDPINQRLLNVLVPQFQVSYLFDQGALNKIEDRQDLLFAENFINNNNKQNNSANRKRSEEGNYTSLMWFAVSENDLTKDKHSHIDKEAKNNNINPASLCKTINVNSFVVSQYIQVRGRCINEKTIEMRQFTNLDDNYDLESHNYALNLGMEHCQKIFA